MAGQAVPVVTRYLSLYTPSTQSPEVLEELLVGRADIVEQIVDDLVRSVETATKQNHLVIGPRGIGKTHLVSVVYHRLKARAVEGMSIAWLREDPWGVQSIDKLLVAINRAVAAESGQDPIVRADGETSAWFLDRIAGTHTLVLIVENMDSVFKRIKPEGQRMLRSFVNNGGRLVIFGTSPTMFAGVTSQSDPFFGSFRITKLDELTIDEAQELMARVARHREDPELELQVASETGRHRLSVIRHLAGGHPRLWMLFADCVTVDSLDELVPLFLEAMDALTPYYQSRMKELTGDQEEIVAHLCEVRGARTVAEIAEACVIEQKSVSVQLRQLTDKGFVRKAELPGTMHTGDARRAYFELREPLMRICMDVKESRGKPIRLIVEFLRAWFDPARLSELSKDTAKTSISFSYLTEALKFSAPGAVLRWVDIESEPDRNAQVRNAFEAGRMADAIPLGESLVLVLEKSLGHSHRETQAARRNLGTLYSSAGRLAESLAVLQRIVADSDPTAIAVGEAKVAELIRNLGNSHDDTLLARVGLAGMYRAVGRIHDAIDQLENLLRAGSDGHGLIAIHLLGSDTGTLSVAEFDWARENAREALGLAVLSGLGFRARAGDSTANLAALLAMWTIVLEGVDEGIVPLRIGTAMVAWAADHDRKHLLELAVEERAVALHLLELEPLSA
jgi:tetratricopeptide (TPR) repeat protein